MRKPRKADPRNRTRSRDLLVVGLGNPGEQYAHTRHNAGFDVIEALAEREGLLLRRPLFRSVRWTGCRPLTLAQPLTYMNRSGAVVPWLLRRCGCDVDEVLVVTDNLDLPVGAVRLKRGGSNRSHRGIASILDELGTGDFLRLYVGIGRPVSGATVVEHVLGRPQSGEREAMEAGIVQAADAVVQLAAVGPDTVMNDLNRRR